MHIYIYSESVQTYSKIALEILQKHFPHQWVYNYHKKIAIVFLHKTLETGEFSPLSSSPILVISFLTLIIEIAYLTLKTQIKIPHPGTSGLDANCIISCYVLNETLIESPTLL